MLTVISSGTQLSVIDTEHDLDTDTTGKIYQLIVDTGQATSIDDKGILKIYSIVLSGGVEREVYSAAFTGGAAHPILYSVPVPAKFSIKVTLKQIAGTVRNFPWLLLALD